MIYLFDVDGTLTESRQKIETDFEMFLIDFFSYYFCCLVTGSDYDKTEEQLGPTLMNICQYSFNCSGNAIYKQGKLIDKSDWTCPDNLKEYLNVCLSDTGFDCLTGNHIEERIGSVNFSIVGRNANYEERQYYKQYDKRFDERLKIAKSINENFEGVTAVVGGETGIDIFQTDRDKRQVIDFFDDSNTFCFFGDKTKPGGNDYTLAKELRKSSKNVVFDVSGPQETRRILSTTDERQYV